MKRMMTLFVVVLAVCTLCATVAIAGPPIPGTYVSPGTFQGGRATESMPCDLCEGVIGNMVTAESWDGVALGLSWKVSCAQISSGPVLLLDTVVAGTGQTIYKTSYSGGTLWLSGTGAWAGGDASYSGPLDLFEVIATKQYLGGLLAGVVSSINLKGSFDGYTGCFELAITNGAFRGATPDAPWVSGPFPAFQGPLGCTLSGTHGTYWDVHDVTFSIRGGCVVPARTSTWGSLKSLYR
jgi:hypothetical protein